jgi:hypothetical protein
VATRHIEGYAIVSDDGMLADETGVMPSALKFEADARFFANGMDGVDVAVHGRHSHEGQPHSPQRKRLILTRHIPALEADPADAKALFWNPDGASLDEALTALGPPGARLGIVGGTAVFGFFLGQYDVFYLTRAPGVRLPNGRPVFPGVPLQTPEAVLAQSGLVAGPREVLDATNDIAVVAWRRPG